MRISDWSSDVCSSDLACPRRRRNDRRRARCGGCRRSEATDRRSMTAVRRLGVGDVAAMRDLNALYADAFEDAETYRHDRPGDAWLERQLDKDAIILLVAEAEGRVVGGITAYELPKLERACSEIYLYDLAVDERSEEHTSELQSLMRISYAVFCLQNKKIQLHKSL